MKSIAIAALCAVSVAAFTSPAFAVKVATPVMEEIDHNIMEEIDHNAAPEGAAADATIVDPKTVGKPTPKAKIGKKGPKEIPLIDTEYEGRSSDDVTYVTGGVGKDERDAIEAGKADYNLYVTSAAASGEFVGDTRVIITRKTADEVEEVVNVESGPLLYVRLPAGSYMLVAELGEQKKEQKLVVNAQGKAQTVRLTWKLAQ
jgi:hypothetical protein